MRNSRHFMRLLIGLSLSVANATSSVAAFAAPEVGDMAHPKSERDFMDRGNFYLGFSKLKLAESDFDSALKMNPENVNAYVARARVRFSRNNYKGAEADLDKAIGLNPNYVRAYSSRINMRVIRSDLKGALEACDEAVTRSLATLPDDESKADLESIMELRGVLDQALSNSRSEQEFNNQNRNTAPLFW